MTNGWGASVAVFLLGFLMAFRPIAGMDFHWHLAMGQAHLEHGPRLDSDPHTHLPLMRAVDMGAWGGQAMFALAERVGGLALVRVLVAALVGLLYLLAFRTALRLTREPALAWLAMAVVAAAAVHRVRARPDLFSLVGLFVLVDLLERRPGRRVTLGVFALCAVWVNLHPGVVLAPVLIGLRAVGGEWRARAPQVAAAALGACLSPRGPAETLRIARLTAETGPLVPEWRSIFEQPRDASFIDEWILLGLVLLMFVSAIPRLRELAPGTWLLATAAAAVAMRSFRLFYFLGLPARAALEAHAPRVSSRGRLAAAVAAGLLILLYPARDRWDAAALSRELGVSPWTDLHPGHYPVGAADFLASRDLRGHLFHPVWWGGYLGHRLAPRMRTAHDGRITLFGRELAEELQRWREPDMLDGLVRRFDLEVMVLPPGALPDDAVIKGRTGATESRRWLPIYADPIAAVYVDVRGPNWEHNREELR